MLDRLVESRDSKGEKRLVRSFIFGVGSLTSFLFVAGLIFSIFSTNLAMSGDDLELTRLTAPVDIPEPAPEPEPPAQNPKKAATQSAVNKPATRVVNMLRADESPTAVPKEISVSKNRFKARPTGSFEIGTRDTESAGTQVRRGQEVSSEGSGLATAEPTPKPPTEVKKPEIKTPPPPPAPTAPKTIRKTRITKGDALNLVMPVRPAAAVSLGLKGSVKVNVLIDENGNVASASFVSGNAIFKDAVLSAARRSKFRPTKLNGNPVKVSGLIVYNF